MDLGDTGQSSNILSITLRSGRELINSARELIHALPILPIVVEMNPRKRIQAASNTVQTFVYCHGFKFSIA